MTIEQLKDKLPDYAKDTRLNLGSVISAEGAPDLTLNQIYGIALSSAYATKSIAVIEAVKTTVFETLSPEELNAAKAAATIMGMNNIYYRFVHLAGDTEYKTMPAKLRMNVIGAPGIPKVDFELYSLAVSAINGCGMCMEAHMHELVKHGVTKQAVQTSVRIAAVIHAVHQALSLS
jgi:alkyl hydroperoxide reductase subunit D